MFRLTALFSLALAIAATWIAAPLSWVGLRSLLLSGALDADALASAMISLSALSLVAGFWEALVVGLWPRTWTEAAGGLPLSTDASGDVHVQMPNMAPLHVLHMLALFVPLLVFLAVVIAGTTMAAATIGWVVIIAALIGGPLWVVLRRRGGSFDLVLGGADLTVPAVHGRKAVKRIARSEIEDVHISPVVRRGRGGGTFYRVSLRTMAGSELMLAEWRRDYQRAKAFATWLANKLGTPYVEKMLR
jgi:hypothetical protein